MRFQSNWADSPEYSWRNPIWIGTDSYTITIGEIFLMKPHESPRINKKSIRGNSGDSWPVWNRGIRSIERHRIDAWISFFPSRRIPMHPDFTIWLKSGRIAVNRGRDRDCVMPPFHQGLFFPIGPIWTRLSPINQSFNLPDGRPESPPIAQLFLTRLSPVYINESSRLFCQLGKAMYQ